jgi:hypothetical protein
MLVKCTSYQLLCTKVMYMLHLPTVAEFGVIPQHPVLCVCCRR